MKISQGPIKNVSTGNISGILVARKDGEEIKDITIFNGRTEDANIELMKKLKNFAAMEISQENNVTSGELRKETFKEKIVNFTEAFGTAAGISGGIATIGALGFLAYSSPSINSVMSATFAHSGPVARAACLMAGTAMAAMPFLGGYIGAKLSGKAARYILNVEVEK